MPPGHQFGYTAVSDLNFMFVFHLAWLQICGVTCKLRDGQDPPLPSFGDVAPELEQQQGTESLIGPVKDPFHDRNNMVEDEVRDEA